VSNSGAQDRCEKGAVLLCDSTVSNHPRELIVKNKNKNRLRIENRVSRVITAGQM